MALATTAVAILSASCSSGDDASVETGSTAPAPTPAATETTTTQPAEPTATDPVVIEGEVSFDDGGIGDFEVTTGAELLGCERGTVQEHELPTGVNDVLTCEAGDRAGDFTVAFFPGGTPPNFSAPWKVIAATDDFGDLTGSGDWSATIAADGSGATFTIAGDVDFSGVATPVAAFPRLVQSGETDCFDGFGRIDGLREFATVGDTMLQLDMRTQEVTQHGPPPTTCAFWLGDEEAGRRIALDTEGTRVWFGPFDGDWDVEVEFDVPTELISRSFDTNRLIFTQTDAALILDATTGEQVGEPLEGSFANARSFAPYATSGDEALIAVGAANPVGEDGGRLFVLDAATADQVAQLDFDSPVTTLAFDDATGELVVGLFTGELLTVDLATMEVVSEVAISSRSTIGAIGVRPDGLILAYTTEAAELVDRRTGPTGSSVRFRDSVAARIAPDGSLTSYTSAQQAEVYEIAG